MNQQVALQSRVVIEAFPTDGAGVRFFPRVYPDVSHHVVTAVEGFPALAAQERFLPRVDPHVRLQVARSPETLPADAADLRFHVSFHVTVKALLAVETFPAHATDVLGVNLHVVHQRDVGVEAFPAHFTADSGFEFFGQVQCRRHRYTRPLLLLRLPLVASVAVVALRIHTGPPLVIAVDSRGAGGGLVIVFHSHFLLRLLLFCGRAG